MNINILLPRRKRSNPNWLVKLARKVGNYRYFRGKGYSIAASWFMAGMVV